MGRKSEKTRSGRLEELAGLLRSRESWTTMGLSEALDVSHRTLMRDLDFLREKGMPIEGERGRGGGVRLHRNWGVGRLVFDYRETIDLLLSLAVMEKMKSPLLLDSVKSIRNKIALSFPEADRRRIRSLRNRIRIGEHAGENVKASYGRPDPSCVEAIRESFFDMKKLAIQYMDASGSGTRRLIEPHFFFLNWPVWYLLAWDELRSDVRVFRIDRVKSARILPENFRPREEKPFLDGIENIADAL